MKRRTVSKRTALKKTTGALKKGFRYIRGGRIVKAKKKRR